MTNIIIPSKGRAGRARTISALLEEGIDFSIIVEPQETEDYLEAYPKVNLIELFGNDRGISFARNEAVAFAKQLGWKYFWMLDDDLNYVGEAIDGKIVKKPYGEILARAGGMMAQIKNMVVGGLEYQQYAWAAKKDMAFNSYCDTCVFLNMENMKHFKYRDNVKEDRDLVLQALSAGFVTARTSKLCFSNPKNGSNEGGLHEQYAAGMEAKWSARMMELWPGVCVPSPKKDRNDVKIKWSLFKDNKPEFL